MLYRAHGKSTRSFSITVFVLVQLLQLKNKDGKYSGITLRSIYVYQNCFPSMHFFNDHKDVKRSVISLCHIKQFIFLSMIANSDADDDYCIAACLEIVRGRGDVRFSGNVSPS